MYEHRTEPLLSWPAFLVRLSRHGAVAFGLLAGSLLVGMVGYHLFEKLHWIDAFLNTAMLLGGMGPVDPPKTDAGKLFAGIYALYAGLVVITVAAILGTPIFHRILHHFHAESQDDGNTGSTGSTGNTVTTVNNGVGGKVKGRQKPGGPGGG